MNIHKKLKYRIEELDPYFSTSTVPETGWADDDDGLLPKIEKEFDVFVTSDRNLSFQQPIQDKNVHVLLLVAINQYV